MKVIYEDNHLLVVSKLPGEIVHADKTGDRSLEEMVALYLKKKYNKPGNVFVGVVHRLDRPVGGLVLFAKTSKALARMNKLFAEGGVHKVYRAIVQKAPESPQGECIDWLWRNAKQNKTYIVRSDHPEAKRAHLRWRKVASAERYHLLEIELLTGRHHQIRAQLAGMGSPIKGDLKYGAPRSNPDGSISLLSYTMRFEHPVSHEQIELEALPPQDKLWQLLFSLAEKNL
ncbi:MAG: RluA family pseudouridine synthase [Bacteroidales bacterium]|nr:RluA family pseudouridine synthase [Porphyromonas sp.]MDD6933852.1 RluA family pseudouridine synthase [Bacteroidales bacterium]MDY3102073.1 RluA family pseudouridine synthase [Porphyromonas sp.]